MSASGPPSGRLRAVCRGHRHGPELLSPAPSPPVGGGASLSVGRASAWGEPQRGASLSGRRRRGVRTIRGRSRAPSPVMFSTSSVMFTERRARRTSSGARWSACSGEVPRWIAAWANSCEVTSSTSIERPVTSAMISTCSREVARPSPLMRLRPLWRRPARPAAVLRAAQVVPLRNDRHLRPQRAVRDVQLRSGWP